jgi:hypothetical protein
MNSLKMYARKLLYASGTSYTKDIIWYWKVFLSTLQMVGNLA